MKKTLAVAFAALAIGTFSSVASAQSTTYFNIPQAFGKATQGPVEQPQSVGGPFETSWLHLRETHGVGVPSSTGTVVASGEYCNTQPIDQYDSSLLNLIERQRSQQPASGSNLGASGVTAKC